eukprot:366391-Chlamydomonas_euryale.AAC.27
MVVGLPMTSLMFSSLAKALQVTDNFQCLRSFFADDWSMNGEMDVQNVCALVAFRHFQDMCASMKLSIKQKMDVYRTFVLPIFLCGCKMWAWTEVRMGRLEVFHSKCLCRIVGMQLTDRPRLETICEQCGT